MLIEQEHLRSKLSWFDRYSVWALESFRGGGVVGPPALLLLGALWLRDATGKYAVGTALLWASVVACVVWVALVWVRGVGVWRKEMSHRKHVDAFWARKADKGFSASQWLLMGLQVAIVAGGFVAIWYFSR
ncbi:hypothetical protein LZ518_11785 [Sphingomonas sp. RB56-2]|uniref:Uncharacterized protein n=1 Tax=Sphingomonas brevis TaxID=2908206 RepID=A0ABT0SBS8_9SPHN|nr:hypothetical protein [Sphingomonas brevis]MCL6741808.1 hypothetical protein [Sphingomonas brevis]